jgi:hypothetical protein
MSNKIFHNKIKVRSVGDGEIAQDSSWTSDWFDLTGWTDIVVAYDLDVGAGDTNIDTDIDMDVSSHGAYELNNSITEDTGDYTTLEIVSGETGATYTRVDGEDLDDLTRPISAARIKITNNDANENVAANVWIEGRA